MRKQRFVISVVLLMFFAGGSLLESRVGASEVNPHTLTIALSGGAEVPGPGDPDGSGTAELKLNLETGEVCYTITTKDIGPPTAAHVHAGVAGKSGSPKITLNKAEDGTFRGCLNADKELLKDIKTNAGHYYLNVHNAEFPNGAVRGQLGK